MLLKLQGFESPINQYQLDEEPLQKGHLTSVSRARHLITGTKVVVKTVHKKHYNEPGLVQARLEGPTVLKCSSP